MNDELEQFYLQQIAELAAAKARQTGLLTVEISRLRQELATAQQQLAVPTHMMGESNGLSGDE